MATTEQKPKCPVCGGQLRYRFKTQDYACLSGPHVIPLSQLTPMQPVRVNE